MKVGDKVIVISTGIRGPWYERVVSRETATQFEVPGFGMYWKKNNEKVGDRYRYPVHPYAEMETEYLEYLENRERERAWAEIRQLKQPSVSAKRLREIFKELSEAFND